MASGLNIAALARRTGVAPDTLRKWEQRYGILRPQRTSGGQRRYSELDVARVEWLRARLAEGYRIGEAAALLGGDQRPPGAVSAEDLVDQLYAAAAAGDQQRLGTLLDQAFALGSIERSLVEIVAPLLVRIGEGWASGELSVAHEHLASEAVRARLERLLADERGSVRGVAVLACGPGERHELGLLMLAVLLRADGWQVAYLGADTPVEDALGLADQLSARVLGVSVKGAESAHVLEERLAARDRSGPLQVVIGGGAATPELAERLGAHYANGKLPATVATLRSLALS